MKKKLLTLAMAATMVVSSVFTAFADETVECSGWWVAHSQGYEVDADGLELSFKNTTYDTAVKNWDGPIYVVYTGDEAKVNGAGYAEYGVARGDLFGWNSAANTGDAAAFEATGNKFEKVAEPADWAGYLTALKAGADCKLKATLNGDELVVEFTVADATSKATWKVDGSKKVYISVGGENCTLTEVKEVAASATPSTGDYTAVLPVALVALAAAGAVVASRKKVTE